MNEFERRGIEAIESVKCVVLNIEVCVLCTEPDSKSFCIYTCALLFAIWGGVCLLLLNSHAPSCIFSIEPPRVAGEEEELVTIIIN